MTELQVLNIRLRVLHNGTALHEVLHVELVEDSVWSTVVLTVLSVILGL